MTQKNSLCNWSYIYTRLSTAEQFGSRWRREYLQTLQSRRKWQQTQENIQEGDLVILKDFVINIETFGKQNTPHLI
jgi:hypothetical protein